MNHLGILLAPDDCHITGIVKIYFLLAEIATGQPHTLPFLNIYSWNNQHNE